MPEPQASVVSYPGTRYPLGGQAFSPSERYPEYAFGHISGRPNRVYAMVRELLVQRGLDAPHVGSPSWNPLRTFIRPGSRVFVLCNFVYHRRLRESHEDFRAKCVHGSVVRAVVDYALLAAGRGGSILIGNAPVQSCDWDRVLDETEVAEVLRFYEKEGRPVAAADLRMFVSRMTPAGRLTTVQRTIEDEAIVDVDLGPDSLLAQLPPTDSGDARFRVSDYNPDRIESFHKGRSHHYQIHRSIAEADVVVSLSKLKTHEKVGVTCGLKGFVGTVAHKDCLAHHRVGTPAQGGDEYPPSLHFLDPFSHFSDWINRRPEDDPLRPGLQVIERTSKRIFRRLGIRLAGAWHGNDTAWRMALDLARIVHYVDRRGIMRGELQRVNLSVIDGIVGGEGDGPLAPRAVASGTLILSDNVAVGDRIACRLMGFPPERVPIVREAGGAFRFPLPNDMAHRTVVVRNDQRLTEDDLSPVLGRQFEATRGWRDHLGGWTSRGRPRAQMSPELLQP